MKIIGIIQARMNSERLAGKVMLDLMGKPMIWHMYNRLKNSKLLSNVVISTGESENNLPICEYAQNENIPYYSGSELDLIDRLYQTAIKFNATAIVRVTADCPLVDPQIIDQLITEFIKKDNYYDIITNCKTRTFPHGLDVEIYSTSVLKNLWQEIQEPQLREWFPFYIEKNPTKFRILNIKNSKDESHLRWTVDYPEDFEFIKQIYENLYDENTIFDMNDILNLIRTKPYLSKINSKYVGFHNIGAPKS